MSGNSLSTRLSKSQTFILAIVVIIGFLVFYYIALVNACIIKSDTNGVQLVASTLGPIVASIIGYYFGQRPIQPITEAAESAKSNLRQFSAETLQTVSGMQETIERLSKENNAMTAFINNLKSQVRE